MNEHLLYKTQNAKKKSKKKGVDVKWAVDNESYKQKKHIPAESGIRTCGMHG